MKQCFIYSVSTDAKRKVKVLKPLKVSFSILKMQTKKNIYIALSVQILCQIQIIKKKL